MAVIFLGVLASALATEFIGIHALFGAFVFGGMIPHQSRIAHQITSQLQTRRRRTSVAASLPMLACAPNSTGRSLGISGSGARAIIGVATFGKFGGTILAARWSGCAGARELCWGTLMNTRGLMELIVLNKGLELGVISPTLFAMLVIMALVTTVMTGPLLSMLSRPQDWELEADPIRSAQIC